MSKKLYAAKKAILPQLEAVIDVVHGLHATVTQISEKFDVDRDVLLEWVIGEIYINERIEDDEDEE